MMNNYIYTPSCSYISYFCFVLFKLELQIFIRWISLVEHKRQLIVYLY